MTSRRGFFGILLATLATAACSSSSTSTGAPNDGGSADAATDASTTGLRVFLGTVDATDVKVAFALENGKVFLFFCGGPMTYATHTKWFRGALATLDSTPFTLQATGWTATGSLQTDGTVKGTLDRGDGMPLAWSLESVAPDGTPGLYEAKQPDMGIAELIISPASQGSGMQGAYKNPLGQVKQVVPLMPVADGFLVQFEDQNGATQQVVVTRAHPS
jgi:hypothetical protein